MFKSSLNIEIDWEKFGNVLTRHIIVIKKLCIYGPAQEILLLSHFKRAYTI